MRPSRNRVSVCYDIVTPESAEQGDVAERGFCDADGHPWDIDDPETLPAAQRGDLDTTVEAFVRECQHGGYGWAESVETHSRTIYFAEREPGTAHEFETGERTSYSARINCQPETFKRILAHLGITV